MKETGVLFTGEMVRAILENRKNQTRRPLKWKVRPQSTGINLSASSLTLGFYCNELVSSGYVLRSREGASGCWNDRTYPAHCPLGQPGDRLWVREAWTPGYQEGCWGTIFREGGEFVRGKRKHEKGPYFNAEEIGPHIRWRPSIHMPRWASRITLEITDIRVQRLQEISGLDAESEGVLLPKTMSRLDREADGQEGAAFRFCFKELWDSIYAKRGLGWSADPWVWVPTFKVVKLG